MNNVYLQPMVLLERGRQRFNAIGVARQFQELQSCIDVFFMAGVVIAAQ
jgi:hypothetical protein